MAQSFPAAVVLVPSVPAENGISPYVAVVSVLKR